MNGADLNAKTWAHWTPTKLAVTYGHFEVAQLLLNNGARVDDDFNLMIDNYCGLRGVCLCM